MCFSDFSGVASSLVPLHAPLGSFLLLSTAMCSDKHVAKYAAIPPGSPLLLLFPLPQPLFEKGAYMLEVYRKGRGEGGSSESKSEARVNTLKSTLSHITNLWYAAIYYFFHTA